jgi:hypothetical protein
MCAHGAVGAGGPALSSIGASNRAPKTVAVAQRRIADRRLDKAGGLADIMAGGLGLGPTKLKSSVDVRVRSQLRLWTGLRKLTTAPRIVKRGVEADFRGPLRWPK